MKTLTNLIENAAQATVVAPKRNTVRSSLRECRGLIANSINTAVGVVNEGLTIANDIVSAVPIIVQGSKEVVTLTGLFARAIALNSILTEDQIVQYDKLSSGQRQILRRNLTENGGAAVVSALTELFSEEDSSNNETNTTHVN